MVAKKTGGSILGNKPRMRRVVQSNRTDTDDSYRKERERNTLAAKQNRDRRKLCGVRLALQVTYLKERFAEQNPDRSMVTVDRSTNINQLTAQCPD